jgi:predicted ATPase
VSEHARRFFVLTGGPGSGKSTLIDALERAGYARSVEAGRGIIQDQVRIGGHALPWGDQRLFAELMLSWELRSYRLAEQVDGAVFFDRGVVDVTGYLRLVGLPVPDHVRKAAEVFRYNPRVFVAPPWREIFRSDAERKQDWDEAVRTYEAVADAYQSNGYELVQLPRVSVSERVRFVVETAGLLAATKVRTA